MLSASERLVAEEYCKGLSDKEVAYSLGKSYWTVKVQKQAIYRKIGVSKDTELLWWLICERLGITFTLPRLRQLGLRLLEDV